MVVRVRTVLVSLVQSLVLVLVLAGVSSAQSAQVSGRVTDETGGVLPGVGVRLKASDSNSRFTVTDVSGRFSFRSVPPGPAQFTFSMLNFGTVRRDVTIPADGTLQADAVMHFVLSADVTVTGRHVREPGRRGEPGREPRRHRAVGEPGCDHRAANSTRGPSCAPAKCSKPCLASSSASTAARARPTSTTCAASTSITAPTSRRRSPACRSTCRRTRTGTATPTSTS